MVHVSNLVGCGAKKTKEQNDQLHLKRRTKPGLLLSSFLGFDQKGKKIKAKGVKKKHKIAPISTDQAIGTRQEARI